MALGPEVALLDPLGEHDLVGGGQELVAPDIGQESCRLSPAPLTGPVELLGLLGLLGLGGLLGRRPDLEADRLELLGELGHLVLTQVELERERLELSRLDVATLFCALQERAPLDRVQDIMRLGCHVRSYPFAACGRTSST